MGISVNTQLWQFIWSIGLGVCLAVLYDAFRIIRIAFNPGRVAAFLEDLLYMLISALITFVFIFNINSGKLRFFIFFAVVLGFFAYYFTLGKIIYKSAETVIGFTKRIARWLLRILSVPLKKIYRVLYPVIIKTARFIKNISQKAKNLFIFITKKYIIKLTGSLRLKRKEGAGVGKQKQERSNSAVTCIRGRSHSGNYDSFGQRQAQRTEEWEKRAPKPGAGNKGRQ